MKLDSSGFLESATVHRVTEFDTKCFQSLVDGCLHSGPLGVVQRRHLLQMSATGKLGENVNSTRAIKLPNGYIQAAKLLIDSVSLVAAFVLAYVFRFDGVPPEQFTKQLVVLCPYVVVAQLSAMHLSGIASFSWRYIGLRECIRIARVMMVPSTLLLFARLAALRFEN